MSSLSQPLGQVLTPKKSNLAPALLLIFGIIIALSAAPMAMPMAISRAAPKR